MDRRKIALEFSKSLDHPNIGKIILYGSVARGEDDIDSDVDILIVSNKKSEIKDIIMKRIGDILLDEDIYISVKVITPSDYENLINTHFISTIEKEGVVIG